MSQNGPASNATGSCRGCPLWRGFARCRRGRIEGGGPTGHLIADPNIVHAVVSVAKTGRAFAVCSARMPSSSFFSFVFWITAEVSAVGDFVGVCRGDGNQEEECCEQIAEGGHCYRCFVRLVYFIECIVGYCAFKCSVKFFCVCLRISYCFILLFTHSLNNISVIEGYSGE